MSEPVFFWNRNCFALELSDSTVQPAPVDARGVLVVAHSRPLERNIAELIRAKARRFFLHHNYEHTLERRAHSHVDCRPLARRLYGFGRFGGLGTAVHLPTPRATQENSPTRASELSVLKYTRRPHDLAIRIEVVVHDEEPPHLLVPQVRYRRAVGGACTLV